MSKTVLITGVAGMIGTATVQGALEAGLCVIGVDRKKSSIVHEKYFGYVADLSNKEALSNILSRHAVDRIIHLAALAHASDGKEYGWDDYKHLNVDCAKNIFALAGEIPVLFISTVDVYGFTNGMVNVNTEPKPVSHYAKSKLIAENACRELQQYTIFRLSPVYTDTIKRDIQKRYYLKYPSIAYQIGKETEYEVLNIRRAAEAIVEWCFRSPQNEVRVIKDVTPLKTSACIKAEKEEGRAKFVLYFPKWICNMGYWLLLKLTGENKYTYLLNKAVNPLRTE